MKRFTEFSVITIMCMTVAFLFQAFDVQWLPGDNDPNVDHVPYDVRLYYAIHPPQPQPLIVVSDASGYDNFNIGTDFAEVFQSTSPSNPLQIFNAYNTNGGHWTTDGFTWSNVTPPAPNSAGDPYSDVDSLGNLYYITLNSSVTGSWVMKSTNMGQTWGSAVSGCTGNDRETIACDKSGGPYSGYIYCGETPGNFYRSTNGGASFTMTASMSNTLPGFLMASGPGPTGISGGAVYVVTSTGNAFIPTYTFYRSTDGGATFSNMSVQNNWVNTVGTQSGGRNSVNNMRLRPYPFMYCDNTFGAFRGRTYIFYAANNPPGNGFKPSVYMRYSTDGCVTFSNPIMINDDANPTTNHHFQEQAFVDKITGKLFCQWMDTRNCPTSDSAQIFASMSSDGGVTWATNQNLSTAKMKIDCSTCPGGGTPRYQGDYTGCSGYGNISMAAWTDFRAGNFGSYTAYFPDYAMKINNNNIGCFGTNDSVFTYVSVPSTKLYTDKVKFSTVSITPPPSTGTITVSFLNRTTNALLDTLSTLPDSVKIRIRTSGGVPNAFYTITIQAQGRALPNAAFTSPVHQRTINLNVGLVGVTSNSNEIPKMFYLYQNYPNPFNPTTKIRFDVAKAGNVKVTVYDITGQKITELVSGNYAAGKYTADFNASNYASGVYFYKIETTDFTSIRKMILVK